MASKLKGDRYFGPSVARRKAGRPSLPPEIRDGIALRLRELWEGLPLKEVATRLGYEASNPVHLKRLQGYQAPKDPSTPDLNTLIKISTAFRVGLDYLVFNQTRGLPVDPGSVASLNAALGVTVEGELTRRYDYDPSLIVEFRLPEDFVGWMVDDFARRIAGYQRSVSSPATRGAIQNRIAQVRKEASDIRATVSPADGDSVGRFDTPAIADAGAGVVPGTDAGRNEGERQAQHAFGKITAAKGLPTKDPNNA